VLEKQALQKQATSMNGKPSILKSINGAITKQALVVER
jgi:hypothetical protein